MATVIQNVRRVRKVIMEGNLEYASDLRLKAINAIVEGVRKDGDVTPEWKALMEMYALDDQDQLDRLCGKDEEFFADNWGRECLAYIAANSTCGIETATMTGSERSFNPEMYEQLEKFESAPTPDLEDVPKCPEDSKPPA